VIIGLQVDFRLCRVSLQPGGLRPLSEMEGEGQGNQPAAAGT
jgi:hypothetical protein